MSDLEIQLPTQETIREWKDLVLMPMSKAMLANLRRHVSNNAFCFLCDRNTDEDNLGHAADCPLRNRAEVRIET